MFHQRLLQHTAHVYESQDTETASSDENYVVHNEMLDRKFTLQGINSAIKHLNSVKASESDYIGNEYISYENKQLKQYYNFYLMRFIIQESTLLSGPLE